jgi:hypothetical protein
MVTLRILRFASPSPMEDEDLIDFDKARPAGLPSLKLPAFWVDKLVSWLVLAESCFQLHVINRVQTRYDLSSLGPHQGGRQPCPGYGGASSGAVAIQRPQTESARLTSVDGLSKDRSFAQDGAVGRQEAFGAAGLHAGAVSWRP